MRQRDTRSSPPSPSGPETYTALVEHVAAEYFGTPTSAGGDVAWTVSGLHAAPVTTTTGTAGEPPAPEESAGWELPGDPAITRLIGEAAAARRRRIVTDLHAGMRALGLVDDDAEPDRDRVVVDRLRRHLLATRAALRSLERRAADAGPDSPEARRQALLRSHLAATKRLLGALRTPRRRRRESEVPDPASRRGRRSGGGGSPTR